MNTVKVDYTFHQYCVDCPNLELDVRTTQAKDCTGQLNSYVTISCENYYLCSKLKKHLERI